MARPKGSKNKSTLAKETEPREFDYERDDIMFDNSYRETGAQPAAEPWTLPPTDAVITTFEPSVVGYNQLGGSLYLVEGEVQMSPREPGRGSGVAKQLRLVSASNEEEAVGKYSNYFRSLSDASANYSVLRAAAMETIQ